MVSDASLVLGRALFAVAVSSLALGNLLDLESSVGYAQSKGVPLAPLSVPLGSASLIVGAVLILVGYYPALGSLLVVAVLVPITVAMHDFWTMEGQSRQNEQIHFLKNAGLLGGALLVLALSGVAWPLALGVGF